MRSFVVANSNGEILRNYNFSSKEMMNSQPLSEGEFFIEAEADLKKQFIDVITKEVKDKPQIVCIFPDTVTRPESLVISNLPIPCKVIINKDQYIVDDGLLDIEFEYPGQYLIEIKAQNKLSLHKKVSVL